MLNTRPEAGLVAASSQEGPWGTEGKVGSEQVEITSLSPRQTHHRTRLLVRPWHTGTGKEWAAEPGDRPERKPMATSIQMTPKSSPRGHITSLMATHDLRLYKLPGTAPGLSQTLLYGSRRFSGSLPYVLSLDMFYHTV